MKRRSGWGGLSAGPRIEKVEGRGANARPLKDPSSFRHGEDMLLSKVEVGRGCSRTSAKVQNWLEIFSNNLPPGRQIPFL